MSIVIVEQMKDWIRKVELEVANLAIGNVSTPANQTTVGHVYGFRCSPAITSLKFHIEIVQQCFVIHCVASAQKTLYAVHTL